MENFLITIINSVQMALMSNTILSFTFIMIIIAFLFVQIERLLK